jgi:hypothetical protein
VQVPEEIGRAIDLSLERVRGQVPGDSYDFDYNQIAFEAFATSQ